MVTLIDLLFVALFAVALPLYDYLVSWPAVHRQLAEDPARARKRLWTEAIVYSWILVAIGAAVWLYHGRSWASLGFSLPDGWRLRASGALVLLLVSYLAIGAVQVARDPKIRENVRGQAEKIADMLPHTQGDMTRWAGVSLTAGFCEEFLFRGYFIWALSPWLGWWGAAALSLAIFALGHLYQGWSGVLRTGIVGALFTLVLAIFGSLWPVIALHALLDLGNGLMAWLALREEQAASEAVDV